MAIGDKHPVLMGSDRAVPNGVATLDGNGKLVKIQLPNLEIVDISGLVATLIAKQDMFSGAGFHNSIYRGKYLGDHVTDEQWEAIRTGTFDDLYIGDYWTIDGVNWRIAAFNYWLNCGDIACATYHVVVVPDTNLYAAVMNSLNVTTGAYVGSEMYTKNLEQAKTKINDTFGAAHILNHRTYLANAVNNGYESAGAWYDSTVELMTEQNVYGSKVFHNSINGTDFAYSYTIDKSQFPLFALEPSRICNRVYWWLRDVASASGFCNSYGHGNCYAVGAANSCGVRPAFGIKA